jgi:hypothetical protein
VVITDDTGSCTITYAGFLGTMYAPDAGISSAEIWTALIDGATTTHHRRR